MVDAGATAEKAGAVLAEAGYDNPTSKQIDRTVNLLEGLRALYRDGGT